MNAKVLLALGLFLLPALASAEAVNLSTAFSVWECTGEGDDANCSSDLDIRSIAIELSNCRSTEKQTYCTGAWRGSLEKGGLLFNAEIQASKNSITNNGVTRTSYILNGWLGTTRRDIENVFSVSLGSTGQLMQEVSFTGSTVDGGVPGVNYTPMLTIGPKRTR